MPAGPPHPERVDTAHDDIGPIERLLGLLELEGYGCLGDLEVEAGADQAHLMAIVRERKGEGCRHYAGAKNANGRHASLAHRSGTSQQAALRPPLPARPRHGSRSHLARTVRPHTPR